MILTNWTGVNCRTPSGSVVVYVSTERCRFVMPTRFLNLLMFIALLNQTGEEFGYPTTGRPHDDGPMDKAHVDCHFFGWYLVVSFWKGIYNMSHGIRKKE
ncbi:hypothetical protein C2S52_006120 [Perilla frutescens var. hirtella]|nr:hypothetical protein C2S52_006120 [Perilla frutescens var. hirtella]